MSTTNDHFPGSARIKQLLRHARTAWRLMRDPRVPLWQKAIPLLGVAYLVSPIDLVPDFLIPLLGPFAVADDLAILLMALGVFIEIAPTDVVAELDGRPAGTTIDATYRVDDPT